MKNISGRIFSINISMVKGDKKESVSSAVLLEGLGVQGDAHVGSEWQLSLLAVEDICRLDAYLKAGDFAENITTEGIDLSAAKLGAELKIGRTAVVRVVKRGKDCRNPCRIYKKHGRCIMPEKGLFAEVIAGGGIKKGDVISYLRR